ncbi:cupin domain-containing protein [Aestuariibacter sp. A3R04]|uniref:cupin domain-containing protein n=1 Tax=Aestuariibacter sp. A3R04 TaxID=2841571 RepID=UPI001C0822BD|nr:cupin domain-containing protein [Aestuariibacter sp. A3R04]MBU3020686.1 cupin domain-containing protein [Aestuariibacter sp. A3R04]
MVYNSARVLPYGEEIFVFSGTFKDEHGEYSKGTWARNPRMGQSLPALMDKPSF